MISPKMECTYNVILSLFLGVVVALLINKLFNKQRVVTLEHSSSTAPKRPNVVKSHFV
jgi:hypothetical protein